MNEYLPVVDDTQGFFPVQSNFWKPVIFVVDKKIRNRAKKLNNNFPISPQQDQPLKWAPSQCEPARRALNFI